MLTRIRPDAIRWLLFGVNLALMALLVWSTLYAFNYNKVIGVALGDKSWYNPVEGYKPVTDLRKFEIATATPPTPPEGAPQRVANVFDPVLPAPLPTPDEEGKEETEGPTDVAEGGPLSSKWALESVMETEGRAQLYAVLIEKPQDAAKAMSGIRGASSFTAGSKLQPATGGYRPSRTTAGKGATAKQKLLRIYDQEANAEPVRIGENTVFFVEKRESPLAILYMEAKAEGGFDAKAKRYMLKKDTEGVLEIDPVTKTPILRGQDPNEDPAAAKKPGAQAPDPDARGAISVDGKQLEPRTPKTEGSLPGTGGPPGGGRVVGPQPSGRGPGGPGGPVVPPTVKDMKDFGKQIKDMNIPPDQLKQLKEGLKGAMKGGTR